jgi:hypothetical protein
VRRDGALIGGGVLLLEIALANAAARCLAGPSVIYQTAIGRRCGNCHAGADGLPSGEEDSP